MTDTNAKTMKAKDLKPSGTADNLKNAAAPGSDLQKELKRKTARERSLDKLGIRQTVERIHQDVDLLQELMIDVDQAHDYTVDDCNLLRHVIEVLREQGHITTTQIEAARSIARFNIKIGIKLFDYSWYNENGGSRE